MAKKNKSVDDGAEVGKMEHLMKDPLEDAELDEVIGEDDEFDADDDEEAEDGMMIE